MLIGEICKKTGLGKDAVRHYEELGLIYSTDRPAGSRTYRDYAKDTLYRIELIQQGKSQGFKLTEMQPWLDLFVSEDMDEKQHRQLVEQKIDEIDVKIESLQKIRSALEAKLK